VEVWQTSNLRRLRLGEERKERKKIEITGQKYNGLPYYIGPEIVPGEPFTVDCFVSEISLGFFYHKCHFCIGLNPLIYLQKYGYIP